MKLQRGFSLIELAIVLVVVTLLIGGLAVPLSAQIQARRIAETQRILEEARGALLGYVISNRTISGGPYLPCPDTDGNGIEESRSGGVCPAEFGWLPWVTLGVGAQDAWGNRLLYAARDDVTNSNLGIHGTLSPSAGWNQICSTRTCTTGDVAANVPAVVVSHGPNGRGALNVSGTSQAAPTGADEAENVDQDIIFVSRPPSLPGSAAGEFDDAVTWLAYPTLVNRACPSGGCP